MQESESHKHQNHAAIAKRLKRAEGHLRSVINMIEAERTCYEIAQQLHAVEAAISNAKSELIHDHIDNCLSEDVTKGELNELKKITKFL